MLPPTLALRVELATLAKALHFETRGFAIPAFIAGGAVRSLHFNHEVRDLDIFIRDELYLDAVTRALEQGDPGRLWGDLERCDSKYPESKISVWKSEWDPFSNNINTPCLEVNVIVGLKVEDFPDSISQMWIDPFGAFCATPLWQEGNKQGTIFYNPDTLTPKRLNRISELFPNMIWKAAPEQWPDTSSRTTAITVSKGKRREPDHAPLWWDLPRVTEKNAALLGARYMEAVRQFGGNT